MLSGSTSSSSSFSDSTLFLLSGPTLSSFFGVTGGGFVVNVVEGLLSQTSLRGVVEGLRNVFLEFGFFCNLKSSLFLTTFVSVDDDCVVLSSSEI